MDSIVVIDIEATCWKKLPPEGEQSEIIEIGVCLFDFAAGEPSAKRSILVKPTRSKVSTYCTKLTTLTQAQVETGTTFEDACNQLESDYLTRERVWASWGGYDQRMFHAQCDSFVTRYPFSQKHVNLKALYADLNKLPKQIGLARAVKTSELVLDGTHHRGDDDAWNAARVLGSMLRQHGDAVLEPFRQSAE